MEGNGDKWILSSTKKCFSILYSFLREPIDNLTPEERDARTVFCMQLAARIRPRDLEEFFSTVGKVTPRLQTASWLKSGVLTISNIMLGHCDTPLKYQHVS